MVVMIRNTEILGRNDCPIAAVKGDDYRTTVSLMTKNEAVDRMKNADLSNRSGQQ